MPAFTLVEGTRVEELGGAGTECEEEVEVLTALCYADQELVNTGNAEEVAAFQRYR